MYVPETFEDVLDCVCTGAALCVACAVALALAVAFCVGVAFLVALDVATGAEDLVAVAVATGVDCAPPIAGFPLGKFPTELEEVSCGGVIARTAPRPPKVPPAIKSARFMPELSRVNLRRI